MTVNINVGIMGFSAQEERKFKIIFAFSKTHERTYTLVNTVEVEPVAVLIVNTQDELVSLQQQSYLQRHEGINIPVVNVIRMPATADDLYYIRGVVIVSRVLPILDMVKLLPQNSKVIVDNNKNKIINNHDTVEAKTVKTDDTESVFDVLVVDDSEMMQKTVQLELEKSAIPIAIDFANTGKMALERIAVKKYDFIFLDVMMHGMDGFETCTEIRKIEGMTKTPIIMLTSKTSALDEVKGLMAGCSTYLTKPFQPDEFQQMLERIIHWVKKFNDGK